MLEFPIVGDFPETYSGCTVFLPAQRYDVAGCLGNYHADGGDTDSGAYVQVAIYASKTALLVRRDHLRDMHEQGNHVAPCHAGVQQHAEVELAIMHAIPAMAHSAVSLPYVNRVLDQLCPAGEAAHKELSYLDYA